MGIYTMEALRMRALLSAAHCIWRQQCRSHKRDAAVLEFALAGNDSFIRIWRRKQAFLLLSSDITALECPYNEDFRDSLAQITIAKQSQNLSGAIRVQ